MGVYIKSMKMPMHCMECELAVYDNDNQKYCPFTNVMCLNIGVQNDCPLTEVPEPHGRLIDESVAYDKIAEQETGYYMDMDGVDRGLQDTPTVIEGSD